MASDQAQFEQMLLALSSSDNEYRRMAEATYNDTKAKNPVWMIIALTEVAANSANPAVSNMALVLLRKVFVVKEDNDFAKLPADQQNTVKQRLLHYFGGVQDVALRKAAGACISSLAALLSTNARNSWPDLWPTLLTAMKDTNTAPGLRASCCEIFTDVATRLAKTYFRHNLSDINAGLMACISSPDLSLQVKAFEAAAAFASTLDGKELAVFKALVPALLHTVATNRQAPGEFCKDQLAQMAGMAENSPDLFQGCIQEYLQTMVGIAGDSQANGDSRRMAIEATISLVTQEAKAVRKVKDFVPSFFNLLFQYVLNPEIESDWATTYEETNDADGSTDFDVGSTGLDRLTVAVGGKAVQQVATSLIMGNIGNPDWRYRAAALTTLTYISEGCRKQFETNLDTILSNVVFPRCADEHPFVRYCALQCIAQCCTDFAPDFQEAHAATVLPLLATALRDPTPRIQALAGGALNNFYDEIDEDDKEADEEERATAYLDPFYAPVTDALLAGVQGSQHIFVKHEMLGALSSVLQLGKARLMPYIDTMVPLFQSFLALTEGGSNVQELRNLKCKAIECTTLLACGVGKAAFAKYAHPVCQYLITVLKEGLAQDDVRLRYVLRGWTCMVECLQEDVLPYLPEVMPQLLAVANLECDVNLRETEVGEDSKNPDDPNIEEVRVVHGESEKRMRIHTALIEDKSLAITILMSIVDELKGHIAPYATEIQKVAIDLLDFVAYGEIRETAAQTLGCLAATYAAAAPQNLGAYLNHVLPQLMVAAKSEPDVPVAGEMLKSLGKILDAAPPNTLSPVYVTDAAQALQIMFQESVEVIREAAAAKGTLDADDEVEAEDLEMEEDDHNDMLCDILDLVGIFLKKCDGFVPIFHADYLPIVHQMLAPNTGTNAHRLAVATLCDFVEHGKGTAVPHLAAVAQTFLQFAACETNDIRQSALYGLGLTVLALHAFVPQPQAESIAFVRAAATAIGQQLQNPLAVKKPALSATANAVSSAIRIIESFGAHVPELVTPLFNACLPHLPCKFDKVEAKFVHDKLVAWLITPGHPLVSSAGIRAPLIAALKKTKAISPEALQHLAAM